MKIRISLPPVFTTFMYCALNVVLRALRLIQSYRPRNLHFRRKMEKKKGKVDDVKDEKEEEGKKKEEDSDPTPSVGLFELVTQNTRYKS